MKLYIRWMKTVLIVAYYWPPAGGGGVQRWVKFVKYLREFGWEPRLFLPENPDYPLLDESLAEEVPPDVETIRQPIFEPRRVFKAVAGRKKATAGKSATMDELFYLDPKDRSWKQNLSIWLRGNLFIPDARVTWVRPAVRRLARYLEASPVDAIITTGPPHSLHLIGRKLKKKTGIPWIADFRDPWTEIEFYEHLMLTAWADRKHRRLSEAVTSEADAVAIATYYWQTRWPFSRARNSVVITNGWDESDFPDPPPPLDSQFTISHLGTLAFDRNPEVLWQSLGELCREDSDFARDLSIRLYGKSDPKVLASAASHGLEDHIVSSGWVSHSESVAAMRSAQVLLLLINKSEKNAPGRMTGKIFEYLAARRPILVLGPPEGDAGKLVERTDSGAVVGYDELEAMKEQIRTWYDRYRTAELTIDSSAYAEYSRRNLTRRLAELLDTVTKAP